MKFSTLTSKLNKYKTYSTKQKILVLFAIALVLVALTTSIFGYRIGHKQGVRTTLVSMSQEGEEQVSSVQVASLKQQLDAVVQERDISLSNLETLREQNDSLKTKNLQLKQFNDLLLDNIAKEGGIPLKLLAVQINSMPNGDAPDIIYEYGLDVAIVDKSGKAMMVSPRLTLLDDVNEAKVDLPLQEILGLSHIRGKFALPKDFKPTQMRIELKPANGHKPIEQLYNWSLGKTLSVTESKGISERPIGSN